MPSQNILIANIHILISFILGAVLFWLQIPVKWVAGLILLFIMITVAVPKIVEEYRDAKTDDNPEQ
jgi:ABC-type bacteriocin/lantibiotic exporter with double-glycine peptidase domain